MKSFSRVPGLAATAAAAMLISTSAHAADSSVTIRQGEGVFIDGSAFKIVVGKAKNDDATQIKRVGARELGSAAIIFRSGNKLYIVDDPKHVPASLPQTTPANAPARPPASPPAAATTATATPGTTVTPDQFRANRIRIEYVPPTSPAHQHVYDLLRERRALETLQQVFSPFRLPFDMKLKTFSCGMSNAWYERKQFDPVINICYEYLDEILRKLPQETTAAGVTRQDAAVGQLVFVATHELGHALFDLYHVPILGREEDAADQIAAYLMLQFGKDRARGLIKGTAYSYREFIRDYKQRPGVTLPLAAFSSNHGQPQERFYNLLCIAYGADPVLFADVVENDYLPKTRADGCKYEYRTLMKAFKDQITPFIDQAMAAKVLDTKWLAGAPLQ